MSLPAGRQRRRPRRGRVSRLLRDLVLMFLENRPFPEALYVELRMEPTTLLGPRARRLAVYERCSGVLILMDMVSGSRAFYFITGVSRRRGVVAFLIRNRAPQLRRRRHRARTRARRRSE